MLAGPLFFVLRRKTVFRTNLLRFASQPDDFLAEKSVIDKFKPTKSLVWASGGCNYLNLVASFPEMNFDCFDPDVIEVEHLKSKISCLKRKDHERMNYLHNDQDALNQCGSFESLLRIVRRYFYEFVVEHDSFNGRFWDGDKEERTEILDEMFKVPAWERAFPMFFSKPSLEALVGGKWAEDSCTQVRDNIESLLRREDASENWFLKHLFIGEYDELAKPPYLSCETWDKKNLSEILVKQLWDLPLEDYNFISLGAYLDFLEEEDQKKAIQCMKERLEKGSVVVIRTLRHKDNHLNHLEPDFFVDKNWGDELLMKDKSYLFSHLAVAIKE